MSKDEFSIRTNGIRIEDESVVGEVIIMMRDGLTSTSDIDETRHGSPYWGVTPKNEDVVW